MIIIDNSILKTVASCTSHAVMRYIWHLESKTEKLAADCGSACHVAFECYFKTRSANQALSKFDQEYKGYSTLNIDPNDPQQNRLEWSNVRDILEAWFDGHPVDSFPFDYDPSMIERGFSVKLSKEVELFALVDMPVKDKLSGEIKPLDHKTTGQPLSSWWQRQFKMSSQITGYMHATQLKYGKQPSSGLINALQINRLPRSSTRCKIHKMPFKECTANIQLRKEHINSKLLVVGRNQGVTDQWLKDAIRLAERFDLLKRLYPTVEYMPLLPMEGAFSDGCTFCDYNQFCVAGRPENLIDGLFVESPWRPWDRGNS